MTRRVLIALMALSALVSVSGTSLLAHAGHDHKVTGTVTMAAADHVMVKTTEGKDVTIQLTKATKVTRGKETMKAEDIKIGTRVVITASSEKDEMKAKLIQVGVEAKPSTK